MKIAIIEPLERAYEHMKGMLFAPFDLGKLLVIGFGCWLARLAEGGSGGGGGFPSWAASKLGRADAAPLSDWEWLGSLREQAWLFGCGTLVVALLALVLVLIPLVLWLSSRGHFVFLDNVIHDRAEIQEPWSRFATQGNSLFLWRLGFLVAALVVIATSALPLIYVIYTLQNRGGFALGEALTVTACVLPIAALGVAIAYVNLFLLHFVVPIMHREGVSAGVAWGRFMPLLRRNLGSFLIYGLFVCLLWICVAIALGLVIVFSCCLAAIPLIIPYLGTVALLPVYVVFRAYGVEFLGQLMPAITLEPPAAPVAEAAG
jgi:hypothetical protein